MNSWEIMMRIYQTWMMKMKKRNGEVLVSERDLNLYSIQAKEERLREQKNEG